MSTVHGHHSPPLECLLTVGIDTDRSITKLSALSVSSDCSACVCFELSRFVLIAVARAIESPVHEARQPFDRE